MKSLHGRAAFRSIETPDGASYATVVDEYYNAALHPTCADFRSASEIYLKKMYSESSPQGRIADIGCGESLLVRFAREDLVLIDESKKMLDRNVGAYDKRQINVATTAFGVSEFRSSIGYLEF